MTKNLVKISRGFFMLLIHSSASFYKDAEEKNEAQDIHAGKEIP